MVCVWGCRDVFWGVYVIFSRTQKLVTLSSTEAKYFALAAGIIFFTVYLELYLPGPRRWMYFSQGG